MKSNQWIKWREVGQEEYHYLKIGSENNGYNTPVNVLRSLIGTSKSFEAEFVPTKDIPTEFLSKRMELLFRSIDTETEEAIQILQDLRESNNHLVEEICEMWAVLKSRSEGIE